MILLRKIIHYFEAFKTSYAEDICWLKSSKCNKAAKYVELHIMFHKIASVVFKV